MARRPPKTGPDDHRRGRRQPSSPVRRRLIAGIVVAVAASLVAFATIGVLALHREDTRQRLAQISLIRISHLSDAVRFQPAPFLANLPMTATDVADNAALRKRLAVEGDILQRLTHLGGPIDAAIDKLNASVAATLVLVAQQRFDEARAIDRGPVNDAYQVLGSDAPNNPAVATTTALLVPAEVAMSRHATQIERDVSRDIVIIVGGVGALLIGLMLAFGASRRRWAAVDAVQRADLEAADRLEALVRTSWNLIVICDVDGTLRFVSAASMAILGVPDAELTGTSLIDLLHSADREPAAARLRALAAGEDSDDPLQLRIRHGDGTYRLMDASLTNLIDDPAVGGIVANLRDITHRTRLEVELRHAQTVESVGQLGSGIAHEINTPIQFVGDNVRFLGDAFEDLLGSSGHPVKDADVEFLATEVPQAIAQTLEGIDRVANIVRAMKSFGHPGNDEKSATDLNLAVENTLIVARNTIKHVADVVVDLGDLPRVWCYPGDVNQVLVNLVVNAAHAVADKVKQGGERGTITIRTRVDGSTAVVDVADTGTGIPADIAARVFEPFFTTKEVGRGTGQGLALAYTLVTDRHAGLITFTSEPGVGTTFTMRLPISGRPQQAAPPVGKLEERV